MKNQIEIKDLSQLTAGDILGEDIADFKAGTILDSNKIDIIKKRGISSVHVFIIENEEEARRLRAGIISKEISERINELLGRTRFSVKMNEEEITEEKEDKDKDILTHIEKSRNDVVVIESGEKVALSTINDMMNRNIQRLESVLNLILIQKNIEEKVLEEIVNEFIIMTGPKRDSSLLLLGIIRKGANIIVKHAVNTCLLSLAIGIELTKIMNEQLQKPEVIGDQKKLKICNSKIFDRDELIKLGISAILHDIGLVDVFPDIKEDSVISKKDLSKLHLHPSRAYSFLTSCNLDFNIRKAVLQHHERIDGSGYPDGIEKRLFSKYSLVLSFANYFDLRTTKNPFEKKSHPQKALMSIIQNERKSFDDDVLFAFCRAASLYPIGSWVVLSDDTIGLVIKSNNKDLRKPILKVVYSADLKELTFPVFVDLSNSNLTIKDVVDVESIEIFDPRYERFIFDEREFKRIPVSLPVNISIVETDVKINGIIENLSPGGMKFKSGFQLSKGQHLKCSFNFNNRDFKNILSLIVWNKKEDSYYLYGVRFLDLDKKDHSFLKQYI